MGRGFCRVVCSDAARHGRTDGGGPREIRFARREVQNARWFIITPKPRCTPSWVGPLRNLFSLFVTNSFSIRILDTPPSRDTHARLHTCTHRKRAMRDRQHGMRVAGS